MSGAPVVAGVVPIRCHVRDPDGNVVSFVSYG